MKLTNAGLSLGVFVMTIFSARTVSASCEYGRETCKPDYVWREAFPGDHVCVPRASHDRAREDNALAVSRRTPDGGPYGPDTCKPGYVWREASPADHVCVPGDTRDQTWKENALANDRRDPSCAAPPVSHSFGDTAMVLFQSRTKVVVALTLLGIAAFVLILIANSLATAHATGGVAPKAMGSLFYVVVVWLWPVLCALPDYYMRQKGDPIYRVPLSQELIAELGFDSRVAIGMAAFCVAAIVLGKSAIDQIRGSQGRLRGVSIAQAGRTLGYLILGPLVVWYAILLFLFFALSGLAH
jgi:hypothetical protein